MVGHTVHEVCGRDEPLGHGLHEWNSSRCDQQTEATERLDSHLRKKNEDIMQEMHERMNVMQKGPGKGCRGD